MHREKAEGRGERGGGSFSRFRDALKRGLNLTVVRNAAIITSPPCKKCCRFFVQQQQVAQIELLQFVQNELGVCLLALAVSLCSAHLLPVKNDAFLKVTPAERSALDLCSDSDGTGDFRVLQLSLAAAEIMMVKKANKKKPCGFQPLKNEHQTLSSIRLGSEAAAPESPACVLDFAVCFVSRL